MEFATGLFASGIADVARIAGAIPIRAAPTFQKILTPPKAVQSIAIEQFEQSEAFISDLVVSRRFDNEDQRMTIIGSRSPPVVLD